MSDFKREAFMNELNKFDYNFSDLQDVYIIGDQDKILIPILLRYLDETENHNTKQYLVRCLSKKGYIEVTEKLLQEFFSSDNQSYKWVIGNALEAIRDKRFLQTYIEIVQDPEHGISRQMIVLLLGFIQSEEAKDTLLNLLHDDDVALHAIISLGRYKDKNIIRHLAYFLDDDNGKVWIERIKHLKKKNPKYERILPKEAWRYMKKKAEKAIKKLSKL